MKRLKPIHLTLNQPKKHMTYLPQTWLHSAPYFELPKEYGLYAYSTPTCFSFEGGGFVAELRMKRLVVRDSNFLFADSNGKANKHRTIGLYDGGLAVFLDGFNVEIMGDVCRSSWRVGIAVKGFTWKGSTDVGYDKLSISENWQAKTNDKEQWAGFIVETSATEC